MLWDNFGPSVNYVLLHDRRLHSKYSILVLLWIILLLNYTIKRWAFIIFFWTSLKISFKLLSLLWHYLVHWQKWTHQSYGFWQLLHIVIVFSVCVQVFISLHFTIVNIYSFKKTERQTLRSLHTSSTSFTVFNRLIATFRGSSSF